MTDNAKPQELLDNVNRMMQESVAAFERGETVDMQAMEQATHHLCQTLQSLPKEEARTFTPAIEQLICDMNDIATRMNSFKEDIEGKITETDQRHTAHSAYHNSAALDGNNSSNS